MAMQHDTRDGVAAVVRARSGYVADWHPILCAVEVEPGEWHMVSTVDGTRYGIIRLLEVAGERGYRVVTGDDDRSRRRLIGYYRTLRAAALAAHRRWIDAHARPGGINGR